MRQWVPFSISSTPYNGIAMNGCGFGVQSRGRPVCCAVCETPENMSNQELYALMVQMYWQAYAHAHHWPDGLN